MDRARTAQSGAQHREGALNHLGLFAFNWTRLRTNLSRERELHEGEEPRKGERFVIHTSLQIRLPQICTNGHVANWCQDYPSCFFLLAVIRCLAYLYLTLVQ